MQIENRPRGGMKNKMSRQPRGQIEVIVHNDISARSLNDDIINWFRTEFKPHLSVEGSRKDKSSLTSNASPVTAYTLSFDESSEQESQKKTILEKLERSWCEFVTPTDRCHLWLEIKEPSMSLEALSSPKHKVEVTSMSLGSFPSPGKYCRHWSSGLPCPEWKKISICFEYDLEIATISYIDRIDKWKLETSFDHLDKFLLVTPTQTSHHVYLFQKNPFKIFQETKLLLYKRSATSDVIDKEEPGETESLWERQIHFADCQTNIFGSSNVVHLELGKSEIRLNDVMSRFAKLGFKIVNGNPAFEIANPLLSTPIAWPRFESFRHTYAWYCLAYLGFKVTDQITETFLCSIREAQHESWFEATLKAVKAVFDSSSICNLESTFKKESEKIRERTSAAELEVDDIGGFPVPHVVAIRRLILTPTTLKGLGEEWTVENRILRKYGAERFVRVSFRDEDFTRLTGYIPIQEITNRVINCLTNGFRIGDQHYRFLGCSNSQLRSHSVWMYASDGQHTVDSIRTWMGDVSHERCVATYVSRLGQCFTSTRNTVEVKNVERIEDIKGNTEFCFTDGIGRISGTLANRVKKTLKLRYTPSAFQIRFGGCKGVVAVAPDIGEEEKLQIRKSMEKFPSDHNHIEVVETTRPVRLSLNRQAILLLSGLGVPDDSFFSLQDRMLENMANILIDEDTAAKVIAKAHIGLKLDELKASGISVTLEPFLRDVLANVYRQRFNDLLGRTHIEIPEDRGRMMMGTVDEFACLEYGEVFIQFSRDIDKPMQDKTVVGGSVVVTKSPCFHPGDMRKFRAVDRAELHHMVDCIVFPARGQRPHPNEMSGSDLDGDLYFVCWEESLIPPGENEQPMDFTSKAKQDLPSPVTESDMIRFIGHYIESDQLGVIANAHLVHADSMRIHCDQCIKIAELHSDAVDFPKTGQPQRLPPNLRPASYPDYMMKTDKPSYISEKVIGKLFHQCRAIELSNDFRKLEPILPDLDLILPGHEAYLGAAWKMKATYDSKIEDLKAMYGIETEVELLSVGALEMKARLGQLKGDHYTVTDMIKLHIDRIRAKMRNMFYEEFGGTDHEHDNALLCLKASALYRVSYSNPEQDKENSRQNKSIDSQVVAGCNPEQMNNSEGGGETDREDPYRKSLGLPWIFGHLLCMIKQEKTTVVSRIALQELSATEARPTSFLHKLSLDIAAVKISNAGEGREKHGANSREQSGPTLTERLLSWNNHLSVEDKKRAQLIFFGSAVTACTGYPTSLDILVYRSNQSFDQASTYFDEWFMVYNQSSEQPSTDLDDNFEWLSKIGEELAKHVGGSLLESHTLKRTNKVKITNIPGTITEITLYSDVQCLRRTAYIVAALTLNRWTIPVLKVVLQWGRNCRIAGCSRDSLLTEEELTIMFYHAVMNGIELANPVTKEYLSRSNLLIMENHFQTCNLFQCTHLQAGSSVADGSSNTGEFREATDAEEGRRVKEDSDCRCGRALLGFFRFYGTSRGSNLKEIPDPRLLNDKQCLLLNLKDQQYVQVGEQMVEAYHSLANCATIGDFINPNCMEDRHFSMVLPNEVTSLFERQEKIWENILKRESGASVVNIRKKKFRGVSSGHMIEAWGSAITIKRLITRIQGIRNTAVCFTEGKVPRSRWFICESTRTIFEGIYGPDDVMEMFPYSGRCQTYSKQWKQVPLVTQFDPTDAYNVEQLIGYFEEQREFIRKNHMPELHGGCRVTISYGNFYTVRFPLRPITAGKLMDKLFKRLHGVKGHVKTSQTSVDHKQDNRLGTVEACDSRTRFGNSNRNVGQPDISRNARRDTGRSASLISSDTGNSEGLSSCHDSPSIGDVCRSEIQVEQIPRSADHYSRGETTEITRHSSMLHPSKTTELSSDCPNPTLNDSTGIPMNHPSQQHMPGNGAQEVNSNASIHQGNTQFCSDESPVHDGKRLREFGSFVPMNNLDFERFEENFLKPNNFVETEHRREYRANVTVGGSSEIITLDENFELTKFQLQDIKWFVLNVARGRKGQQFINNQSKDIRIQMRSRPFITKKELAERKGCQDLLKDAPQLLHKNSDGVVDGIALSNYKGRIDYMRYKDRTTYQFGDRTTGRRKDSDDNFLNRFTVKANRGKEYRLPDGDGIFQQITDQKELILETDLSNLEDEKECGEFMRQIYEFSKDFARCVID